MSSKPAIFCIALFSSLLMISAAQAAPQMLALVDTDGPAPLQCDGNLCEVQLTAFCLQQDRAMPKRGTPYRLVDGGEVDLIVSRADGTEVRIPASPHLRYASARGFSAVNVTLPRRSLARLGGIAVAVDVKANVALLPQMAVGDTDPLTAAEVADVTGRLRPAATDIVDRDNNATVAARLTSRVINALPSRSVAVDTLDPDLWRKSVGTRADVRTKAGVQRAGAIYDTCRQTFRHVGTGWFRHCLEQNHDRLIFEMNHQYWRAIRSGS